VSTSFSEDWVCSVLLWRQTWTKNTSSQEAIEMKKEKTKMKETKKICRNKQNQRKRNGFYLYIYFFYFVFYFLFFVRDCLFVDVI
jgi:polyferredoxin